MKVKLRQNIGKMLCKIGLHHKVFPAICSRCGKYQFGCGQYNGEVWIER